MRLDPVPPAGSPPQLTEADVRALEPVLRAIARRTVADDASAEDLVQETLLAAVQGLAKFDGRSQLRTWLVSILSHKTVDYFRRARARRWESADALADDDPRLLLPASRSPEKELGDWQALAVLERAFRALPEKERMAVVLCDVEGLDREEVCNVLGLRATHLRVVLHRARHRLRKAMEDADV